MFRFENLDLGFVPYNRFHLHNLKIHTLIFSLRVNMLKNTQTSNKSKRKLNRLKITSIFFRIVIANRQLAKCSKKIKIDFKRE